jgi:hypothetical protein
MLKTNSSKFVEIARCGALAGAAGGLAEVLWIGLYAATTGADATEVARGVTSAVGFAMPAAAAELGVAIHMALAIALGVALAFGWRALSVGLSYAPGIVGQHTILTGALAAVWAVNFFIVLPWISPGFVELVPYHISLASKLLFGLAATLTFQFAGPGQGIKRSIAPARQLH